VTSLSKRRLAGSVFFAAAFLACLHFTAALLENKRGREKYRDFYEDKTGFDAIFLGTSHAFNSILPMELWHGWGITSYNWGYSNCSPAENFRLLPEILRHAKPRLVVLDLYGLTQYENQAAGGNGKYRTDRIEQQHVQFDTLPLTRGKIRGVADIFDNYEGRNDFLWNFIMYHNRWTELAENDFAPDFSVQKGASFLAGVAEGVSFRPVDPAKRAVPDTVCFRYLEKLLSYCSENRIELLCVFLPYPAGRKDQITANSVGKTVEAHEGCTYLNLLCENILDMRTDIYIDRRHLNFTGAAKTTDWLGRYLREHCGLPDHRGDPAYAPWEESWQKYVAFKAETLRKATGLLEKLCLLRGSGWTVRATFRNGCTALEDSKSLAALLEGPANAEIAWSDDPAGDGSACDIRLVVATPGGEILDESFHVCKKAFAIEPAPPAQGKK
jgi:hypothetical protein